LAFFYSALSCMQSAATSVWCRPLLSAVDVAAAAAASAGAHGPASHKTSQFYELFERAEPQVFLDTCVMLICVVLLGKVGSVKRSSPSMFLEGIWLCRSNALQVVAPFSL